MNKVIYDTMIKKRVFGDNGDELISSVIFSDKGNDGKGEILIHLMEDLYNKNIKYTYVDAKILETLTDLRKYFKNNDTEKVIVIYDFESFNTDEHLVKDLFEEGYTLFIATYKCIFNRHNFTRLIPIYLSGIYKNKKDLLLPIFKNDLFNDKELINLYNNLDKKYIEIIEDNYPSYPFTKQALLGHTKNLSNIKKLK